VSVRYAERGASWWPLLWGPGFAAVGAALDASTGRVHWLAWLGAGVLLAGLAALWVPARRRLCAVTLTDEQLTVAEESLAVSRIAEVPELDESPVGTTVLGRQFSVPRKFDEVALRLDDGTLVLAWARHGDRLSQALRDLLDPNV
jgi:hypothetical protein